MNNAATSDIDHADAGFTLVEMLVALTLFSILVIALFDNVSVGLKAFQSGSTRADHAESALVAQSLVRRLISDSYPLFLQDDQNKGHVDFEGNEESVSFLGDAPLAVGRGGRYRFHMFLDRRVDRTDLVLTSLPELYNRYDSPASVKTLLVGDVAAMSLSYFGATNAERDAKWRNRWVRERELPKLVRIRLGFHPGDTRLWPELVVEPRISADVNCTYDPVSKRCRGR
ncbi:MAG TPA: prepilin-type N-terminal cleavage/methylation domain-containing protein [Pseudolabrys sp.]|nr:prepilin-type N-terminal cleavage/methylation domain-containing protein [Pseudolabrys sp.]